MNEHILKTNLHHPGQILQISEIYKYELSKHILEITNRSTFWS